MSLTKFKPFISNVFIITILTVVSAAGFNYLRPTPLSWVWSPPPPMAQVIDDLAIFKEMLTSDKTILVDARPKLFYQVAHIPGAISFPEGETKSEGLATWRQELAQDSAIIIYCSDSKCRMADDLATKMAAIGLTSTIFLPGFVAWDKAGLPVESDISPPPVRSSEVR